TSTGPGFIGHLTANGQCYDQTAPAGAPRTLQMPSIVRVTNLDNGRAPVVRINDRGPFARSRIIDLSRTAAEELDVVRNGTARVRIDQLSAESVAVKDVAINGGGPSEQMAAVAQVSSGRYSPQAPPPVMQAAYTPPPAQPQYVPPPAEPQPVWQSPSRSAPPEVVPASAPMAGGPTVTSLVSATIMHPAGGFYVQTGSFSTPENAERQREAVRSYGTSEI